MPLSGNRGLSRKAVSAATRLACVPCCSYPAWVDYPLAGEAKGSLLNIFIFIQNQRLHWLTECYSKKQYVVRPVLCEWAWLACTAAGGHVSLKPPLANRTPPPLLFLCYYIPLPSCCVQLYPYTINSSWRHRLAFIINIINGRFYILCTSRPLCTLCTAFPVYGGLLYTDE